MSNCGVSALVATNKNVKGPIPDAAAVTIVSGTDVLVLPSAMDAKVHSAPSTGTEKVGTAPVV